MFMTFGFKYTTTSRTALLFLTVDRSLRGANACFGICHLTGLPLVRTLTLDALVGWLEVHRVVAVGEEQALVCCTNICSIAVNLDRVVAPLTIDPLRSRPLTDAPGWIVLGAAA